MHYIARLPDVPTPGRPGDPLHTRRQPFAQIVLCQGCCCGHSERGLPPVPLEFLKPIWKAERLNKAIQLSVSGCLGPCDLPNVATIITPTAQAWYGRLTTREDYEVLLRWARRCREAGQAVPLPAELDHLRFDRWATEQALPRGLELVAQEPGEIVLLTTADTELFTWSQAMRRLPAGFPAVRALQLARLADRRVLDAYLDDVLQEAKVIVLRVLGGLGYFREGFEQIHLLAASHGIALVCLSGDDQPDHELDGFCTVNPQVAAQLFRYCVAGGVANAVEMLRYLADCCLGSSLGWQEPTELPEHGIYHPGVPGVLSLEQWQARRVDRARPVVALLFYRAHWCSENLEPVDALFEALQEQGLDVLPVFCQSLQRTDSQGIPTVFAQYLRDATGQCIPDVVVTTTGFALARFEHGEGSEMLQTAFGSLDVPVLQAVFAGTSENVWAADPAGLSPRDVAMNVAIPEFDGRIIGTAVSFKNIRSHDPALGTDLARYSARADRVQQLASLAARWARLRRIPACDKRVAILLGNYPAKNARIGNAVGLDTPASLVRLLEALQQAGFHLGAFSPSDPAGLMQALIASNSSDREFPGEASEIPGRVSLDQYDSWFRRLPSRVQSGMLEQWGDPGRDPGFGGGGFAISGLRMGNVFIGIQPARGYGDDVSAIYHSPDLAPPHSYLAYYRWIQQVFQADALVHLGKHGNLEWLPGKALALSADCYPEAVLADLPLIYPYIINNPGEGTQAKRRSAAVIVDHLIPPMARAESYGELRALEHLMDEYYTVQSLDPTKAPLVAERIRSLVASSHLHHDLGIEPGGCDTAFGSTLVDELFGRIDGYLCEIKESQIRDGLHVLGQLPSGEQLLDLCVSLIRSDNGRIPGITRALADDLGLDLDSLRAHPANPAPEKAVALGSLLRRVSPQAGKAERQYAGEQACADPMRTAADVIEWLEALARELVSAALSILGDETGSRELSLPRSLAADGQETGEHRGNASDAISETNRFVLTGAVTSLANRRLGREAANTALTLRFFAEVVWPRLQAVPQERAFILRALEGRFVPPGASGAPTRGMANILPTGRNFYSLDLRTIPTESAWRVGQAAAESLLERHRERTGSYPQSIGMVVWGTSNMRTGGDDIAQVLYLLGVRPRWHGENRRVTGIEVIPLSELGRPRLDVTVRMSGFFRDAFPNIVRLIDEAVDRVSRLDEPPEMNLLRAHIDRDTRDMAATLGRGEAELRARYRIFSSPPGGYGAGLLPLLDSRAWESPEELCAVYLNWGCFAYTADRPGIEARTEYERRLRHVDTVVQNQDNREHDIFDSDDYFQFHGGMIAAVRTLSNHEPAAYLGDTHHPDSPRVRTLHEEVCRVIRARAINPKWLRGAMRHGYKGAVELAATVDYLFGYDATAEVIHDWMYQEIATRYLLDPEVRGFLRQHNPWAERGMIERLLEAAERQLWENPDPAVLEALRQNYLDNEAYIESAEHSPARRGYSDSEARGERILAAPPADPFPDETPRAVGGQ